MKPIRSILFRNFISPISIAIFVLAAGLLYLGEARDAWFISFVILVNAVIGSIQEVRAYLTLKKIELMSQPRANKILKNGDIVEILFSELKRGDRIQLKNGDEIPADARIIEANSFEINESMLTGESDAISKKSGDKILASAIVVAGDAVAEVVAVGGESEAGKMASKLKSYKPQLTPIQKNIQKLITYLSYFAVFLAIIVVVRYRLLGEDNITILKTITSAVVVLVPEGLLLASSLFFAYGSLKLLQAKVLPQKISAIEDMALLEVLATDKTGTLTSPDIEFESLEVLADKFSNSEIGDFLCALNSRGEEKNATARAILAEFGEASKADFEVVDFTPFSSARKMTAIKIAHPEHGEISLTFGAPEFILRDFSNKKLAGEISKKVENLASRGFRVLLLAQKTDQDFAPLSLVVLKNALRKNVKQTVDFLQNRGVSIRVISGDNPLTVSAVAEQAGVDGFENFITGAELAELSDDDFEGAVMKNAIFARVLPDQKERIIEVFQKNNLYTGMIGDGVNDALAIKAADLGISMFDAAPATRRVADLVLMDNSFASLPSGAKIGDKIMLSIEIVAILFFHKIIFGVTILLATMLLGVNYPFLPRHITYMNFILVTLPTILVTLFPPTPTRKISPRDFWRDTLLNVLPIALVTGLSISVIYIGMLASNGLVWGVSSRESFAVLGGILSVSVVTTAYFGFLVGVLGERMLASRRTKATYARRIFYLVGTVIFTGVVFGNRFLRNFFEFELAVPERAWFALIVVTAATVIQFWLMRRRER